MQQLSTTERIAKTHRQIELVETALTKEFPTQSAGVIHREVETVSEELIANARFTDHVAVLTGRYVAEHLEANEAPMKQSTLRATLTKSHWWKRH
jgi:hypothetical protein